MQCSNLVLSCEIIIRITDVEIKRNIIMGFTLLSIGHCSVSIIAEYNEKWRSLQICKYYIFLEKRAINIVKKWPLTQKTHFHEISIENITKPWIIILNILYLWKCTSTLTDAFLSNTSIKQNYLWNNDCTFIIRYTWLTYKKGRKRI